METSDESGEVQIYEVVTCFICKEHTSSQLIQLNCFHICHKSCLRELLKNAEPRSRFSCSECKATSLVPTDGVEGYPDELLQYKMKEIAPIFSNSSPPCKICEKLGEENISTDFCITCKMHLCSNDTRRHALQPDHKIIANNEIQNEQYLSRILTTKKARCPVHSTDDSAKAMEFYCRECQKPVCQDCCVTNHKLHTTITVQEASHTFKEKLKNKTTEIPNKKDQYEFVINKLEKLLDEIETNSTQEIEKCKKWGEDVKQNVGRIVNENVQNIKEITQMQRKEIAKIKEEMKDQKKGLKGAKDYMEVFLKFGSESDFLQKYKLFLENMDIFLQQNTRVQTSVKKVNLKYVKEVEKNLEESLKIETVTENHQIEKPPLQLKGCHLEAKWKAGRWSRTGVAVDGDDVIVVRDEEIDVYGMNGQNKGKIECQELERAYDIKIDYKQLVVSDIKKREILVLDRTGKIRRKISFPEQEHRTSYELGLAVDQNMEDTCLYISSAQTNKVYKCTKGLTLAQPFIATKLSNPRYICVTHTGGVIVSNNDSHTVCKFNNIGKLVWKYGKKGTGEGELNGPRGVCVDFLGQVYVCDYFNHRIHLLSPMGKFLSFININQNIEFPQTITFKNDSIIVAASAGQVFVIKCDYN